MPYTDLLIEEQDSTVSVVLNRPEVHNAFDERLIAGLTDCFRTLGARPDVRAVVLYGTGASFCAGADLAWMSRMADYTREENLADAKALEQMFAAIAACPKPTVARVHGAARGGGAGLAAVCDITVAASDATFAFSEVRLGIVPAVICPYVLRKIGPGAARALFVTGEPFSAGQALRLGLVQEVVSPEELHAAVARKTQMLLEAGPDAIAAVKSLLDAIAGKTPADAAAETVACIAERRVSPEGQEGIRAFLEKRKPSFVLGRRA